MSKTKVLSFMPGDDVNIHIKAKFKKFTILKIEAIEVPEHSSSDLNLSF